ncbi:alpha/beta hydrolase [Odoribacter sp. OttesenSCG-928-L07]|nr:alpha/beta hydrolase [Odoribacter sp. OttesenSCG-928-L07]MDL2238898.1 alpha/beta hydrolase [Bacteroidales bacterium OttesenSCG-928-L14]MDL2240638.1 alpha/beta hydrolase [Bacteroidales bacterium OttesenSCG-928-K22]
MVFKKSILSFFFLLVGLYVFAQNPIKIWEGTDITCKQKKSKMYVYLPEQQNVSDVSVIVCPGGSYAHLYGIKWEGFEVAQWLNDNGITAFVLQYRVGKDGNHHPAMIEDVQRAMQLIKENYQEYNIDPDKVGVMGFSAGGHLSLMAGVFYNDDYLKNLNITHDVSLRPAFVVPVYPVVSMQDSIVHARSRKNLLGKKFDQDKKDKFSMELQVFNEMPPVFLVATKDDPVVDYRNCLVLKDALDDKSITNEFLLYETGGHGFGMNEKRGGEAAQWKISFKAWLREIGLIEELD